MTLEQSCKNLLEEEIDVDDLSAVLWKGTATIGETQQRVCSEWSSRCSGKQPKVKGRKDYAFTLMSEKEVQMEELMASMEEAGLGGSMMSRDDMQDQMGQYDVGGSDGDEFDYADEEF
jgi:hypothetical protein